MTALLDTLLTDTVTVQRKSITKDTSGGVIETWATRQTGVAARDREVTYTSRDAQGQFRFTVTHEVITKYDEVTVGDRIRLQDGRTIQVRARRRVPAFCGTAAHWHLTCEEVAIS